MFTAWKITMLCLLPFMLIGDRKAKLRTWGALFAAALAALAFPHVGVYIAIDLVAGAVVLSRPAGIEQKLIGLLFAGMAVFDIGFILGGQNDPDLYVRFLTILGWLQAAILAIWGAHDGLGYYLGKRRTRGGLPAG